MMKIYRAKLCNCGKGRTHYAPKNIDKERASVDSLLNWALGETQLVLGHIYGVDGVDAKTVRRVSVLEKVLREAMVEKVAGREKELREGGGEK